MKKVLIVASVASIIDQFNMNNILLLQDLGYKIDVAANFIEGNSTSQKRVENFKKELNQLDVQYFQIDFSRNALNINNHFKAITQLRKLINKNQYSLIHTHSPIGAAITRIATITSEIKIENKVLYTAHGFHFYKGAPFINWFLYYTIEKILAIKTDKLITINQDDFLLAKEKKLAKSIEYIPGIGIDTKKIFNLKVDKEKKRKEFNLSKNDILILSVGELNKNKNHERVIIALSKVKNPQINYLICGVGSLEEYLKNIVNKLGLENQVHFLGYRSDIIEICKISDIFMFPSLREGLPVSVMEAMASGLPVIANNIRGVRDLVQDGKNGLLLDNNTEEYAEALSELLNDEKKLGMFSHNSKKIIEKFDEQIVNNKMKNIYLGMEGKINAK